jgi:carbon-monoxide dehydrogenase medium subunit
VSLGAVPDLDSLSQSDGRLVIGPMVRLRRLERDPLVRAGAPLLGLACAEVANARVRNTASIGGNLAHGDYRLDPPVALAVLDATVVAASTAGTRRIAIREFFVGFEQTALEHGELIVAIEVPVASAGERVAYEKLSSLAANDWPCASVAVRLRPDGAGRHLSLGIGALAPTTLVVEVPLGTADLEASTALALAAAEPLIDPLPDVRGGAAYKRELGRVAIADALARAFGEAR